jgi:hypothetical protein
VLGVDGRALKRVQRIGTVNHSATHERSRREPNASKGRGREKM